MMMASGVFVPVDSTRNLPTLVPAAGRLHSTTPSDAARVFPSEVIPVIEPENDLEAMARLVRSNDRLTAELRSIRDRLESAKLYLSQPDSNLTLGAAYFDRLRARHSAVLARLRSNRIEARALLANLA